MTMLAVAAAYFVTGRLGLDLAVPPGYATAVWPPSGIALAAVLLAGPRVWPGVLVGSFLVNISTGFDATTFDTLWRSLAIPTIIAGGATLQALGGGFLVRRFSGFPNPLRTVPQIVGLLGLGGVVGCIVNASISVAALTVAGRIPLAGAPFNWMTWWAGDTIGVFVFTPLALALLLRPRAEWRQRGAVVATATGATFLLCVGLAVYTSGLERKELDTQLADTGEQLAARLTDVVMERLHAVAALQAFLDHSRDVTADEFSRFSWVLREGLAGLITLEWAPRVPADLREPFEARARGQGLAGFRISDNTPSGLVPAAARPDYYPITFVEPTGGNLRAVGFDIATNADRRQAMVNARNTGKITVSGRIDLVQGGTGVLAIAPVHYARPSDTAEVRQEAFGGFALGVIRLADITASALSADGHGEVQAWLIDETDPAEPVILAANTDAPPAAFRLVERGLFGRQGLLGIRRPIEAGGRHWVLQVAPTQVFVAQHRLRNSWLVLVGGLLATGLLGAFAMVATGREGDLRALVEQRTRTLEQALAQLGGSEERFRATFEQAAVGMCHVSATGAYLLVNGKLCDMLGYSAEELLGLSVGALTYEADQAVETAGTERMVAGADSSVWEKRYVRKDGTLLWVRVTSSIVRPGGGGPPHFIGVIENIDDAKAAEAKLAREAARYQFLLKTATDGIHVLDEHGALIEASDSFRRMLGYQPDRTLSLNIRDWDAQFDPERFDQLLQSLRAAPAIFGTRHRRADGSVFDVEINSQGVEFEGRRYLYASSRDVTERKRLEVELMRSNADLEQFAYVASHDLRQPLRMVTSYMSLIERDLKDVLTDDTRQFMAFARNGAKHMDRLIIDLLEYSRIGRQPAAATAVSLAEAANDAIHTLAVAIDDSKAEIVVQPELPSVAANPSELVRLFQNLIGNAVKYRVPDRPVVVAITCRRDHDEWVVSVRDNGIGIAADQMDRIFGVFQRLHTREQYEGTGIGLAICRKIVEQYGGRIWVTSAEGLGCDFQFSLPVGATGNIPPGVV